MRHGLCLMLCRVAVPISGPFLLHALPLGVLHHHHVVAVVVASLSGTSCLAAAQTRGPLSCFILDRPVRDAKYRTGRQVHLRSVYHYRRPNIYET